MHTQIQLHILKGLSWDPLIMCVNTVKLYSGIKNALNQILVTDKTKSPIILAAREGRSKYHHIAHVLNLWRHWQNMMVVL